jgi:hypothetical protein
MKHIRNTLRSDFSPVILSDSREGRFSHVFGRFSPVGSLDFSPSPCGAFAFSASGSRPKSSHYSLPGAGSAINLFSLLSAVSADQLINAGERSMTGGEGYVIVPSIYSAGVFTGIYRLQGSEAANGQSGRAGGLKPRKGRLFSQENRSFSQENRLFSQENRSFSQENRLFSQENRLFSQENRSFSQENRSFSQENRSFSQENRSFSQENRSFSQENQSFSRKRELAA